MAYWLLFAVFAAGALISQPDLRRERPLGAMVFGVLLLILMIGLRDRVGVDWANYLRSWMDAGTRSLKAFLVIRPDDPVFYSMLWGLRTIGLPYWALNFICAIPFTWGLVWFARQQPNAWLAVAVALPYLVIVTAMSATRQATAIGFIFLALVSFKRGNNKGFVLWTLIAAAFHSSAILVLPFAGLSLARNRFQSAVLLAVCAVGGYFILGSTFGGYARDYFNRYTVTSTGTVYRVWMNVVPAIIYLLVSKRLPFPEQERTLWRNFAFLAIASVPLLFVIQSTTALDRLLLYAFPMQIMMLAWLPYLFRARAQQIGITLAILVYLGLQQFIFFNYATNRFAHVPYRNILF